MTPSRPTTTADLFDLERRRRSVGIEIKELARQTGIDYQRLHAAMRRSQLTPIEAWRVSTIILAAEAAQGLVLSVASPDDGDRSSEA